MFHKNHVRKSKEKKLNRIKRLFSIGIFSSTIKNNILFGKEYDEKLFQRVVHASALETV